MRVAYVVSSPDNIKNIAQYVASEKLNYCGVYTALGSVGDSQFLAYSKKAIDVSRSIMKQVLSELGLQYLKSETNFIFHKTPNIEN